MKRIALTLAGIVFLLLNSNLHAQKLFLKKGIIIDSLKVHDSIQDSYALFLPKKFELTGKWPLLLVFDMKGRAKQEMAKFIQVADQYNYILAASNAIHDSLSITDNLVRTKRLTEHLANMLPVHTSRVYTAGIADGGRFGNLVPVFLKNIAGTISINAAIANLELLTEKNKFQFVGIVDKENYNYPTLLKDEKLLNTFKFPNSILIGGNSSLEFNTKVSQALGYLELSNMIKGNIPMDSVLINELYQKDISHIDALQSQKKYLEADRAIAETLNSFKNLKNLDVLRDRRKSLRRLKDYRVQKREEEAALFKELLLQEDFGYYLEEDVLTYNFNNLGWWSYQIEQINNYKKGIKAAERQMGHRLEGYVNALISDNIDVVKSAKTVDEEALVFLYMLKTITAPDDYKHYLNVVSIAAKNEDFGTALFYLEEVLKKGFKSKEEVYNIPNTALLRITPEFNALVKKYFEDARYKISDE